MQIILLSGGPGKRLWPLSNGTRTKQFLKLLPKTDGSHESMVQRMVRQIGESGLEAEITLAAAASHHDAIISQLGRETQLVTEPERRHTFPAIALACAYLSKEKHLPDDEIVVVLPCDTFTETGYFEAVKRMAQVVETDAAELVLMGIKPTEPSTKFGYLVPDPADSSIVKSFTEKPDSERAAELLRMGAFWNGGAFGFRLGYMRRIAERYIPAESFAEFRARYTELPRISFDYEVAEKARRLGAVYFDGQWKDLGTWETLSNELDHSTIGYVIDNGTSETTAINELNIPLVCHGTQHLIVAASPDGILVADKTKADSLKESVVTINRRPMFEERRWGSYKVIDNIEFPDGYCALTKQLTLNPGAAISYQRHTFREEVWTFIDGTGEIVLDGERRSVGRGDVVNIPKMQMHALRALTPLTFIEVQKGTNLIEEDIERFPFEW